MPGAGVPEKWQEGRERSVGRSSILVRRFHAPAHISQDSDSEHPAKVATNSRKHSIFTHFPKDRDCDVCLRTKRTRTPCRRRTGEALLWAEKFGDLTTADHKVLNEEGESRNNHRYAVMIQSYPCKTKTSHETERRLSKFLEPSHRPKVLYTDNSMEYGNVWSFNMESPHLNTSSIRDQWHRWKSRSTSQRRYISSIATIGIGSKMVGWFNGMLLLSSKCPRPPGG